MTNNTLSYKIHGAPAYATVEIQLKPGEQVIAEAGAMDYMDGTVQISTSASGGLIKGLKRKLSGESFFMNIFTGPGSVFFSSSVPGDIMPFEVSPIENGGWILSKDAFIVGTPNLEISSKWGGFKSILGGEGAFLTKVSTKEGHGMFFAGAYGAIQKHEIPSGKEFVVDTGLFFAAKEDVKFEISKVGGMKSFLLGGEGLVLRFYGPATIYTQSRTLSGLALTLAKFLPSSQS